MKFGVFISAQQPRSDDSVQRFREAVEQARLAHAAGFDALAAGHHYLSPPYQSLQSLPLMARLAGEAPGMDLCLSVILLALLNPVQTAEEVAVTRPGPADAGGAPVDQAPMDRRGGEFRRPVLPGPQRHLHDPPGAKAPSADLDCR
jgi:hypothetical protein